MDGTITHADAAPAALTAATADRCADCGAPLAADQRYCLECGQRRGDPRMPAISGHPPETPPAPAARRRRAGPTAGTTLVAGVGTLLLAMGVGVLIGRSGDPGQVARAPAVQVVTVAGAVAGLPAPSSSTPSSTAPGATTPAAGKAKDKAKAKDAKSGVAPAAPKRKAAPVVTVGSKGQGKGYQHGKFTGDFFGQ